MGRFGSYVDGIGSACSCGCDGCDSPREGAFTTKDKPQLGGIGEWLRTDPSFDETRVRDVLATFAPGFAQAALGRERLRPQQTPRQGSVTIDVNGCQKIGQPSCRLVQNQCDCAIEVSGAPATPPHGILAHEVVIIQLYCGRVPPSDLSGSASTTVVTRVGACTLTVTKLTEMKRMEGPTANFTEILRWSGTHRGWFVVLGSHIYYAPHSTGWTALDTAMKRPHHATNPLFVPPTGLTETVPLSPGGREYRFQLRPGERDRKSYGFGLAQHNPGKWKYFYRGLISEVYPPSVRSDTTLMNICSWDCIDTNRANGECLPQA